MDLKLHNKRALVTGSTAGIGEAIAKSLAREGARVIIHGRSEKSAARVADEIRALGAEVAIALGDLSSDEQAEHVTQQAVAAFGGVDILVNNAGQFPRRGWWDATPAQWLELYNQNVASMVRTIQALVPAMRDRGWGRVVNIASGAGFQPIAAMPDYAATKAVNILMSVSLAKELGASGVTVNTVSPGPILTPGAEEGFRELAREKGWGEDWATIEHEAIKQFVPTTLGRFGRPEEVAAAVTFLCSEAAAYIHGTNLRVDGGYAAAVN